MANIKYNENPIYKNEIKQKFLNEYTDSEKYREQFRLLFKKSFHLENVWGKDLANFSLFELVDLMYDIMPGTPSSSRHNESLIKFYINWAIDNGIRENKDNPLNTVSKDWHLDFVSDIDYLSKFKVNEIIDRTANEQDAVIIQLLFDGVSGKELWEIRSLRPENIDWETGILSVEDLDKEKREVKVTKQCLRLLEGAIKQTEYIPKNGNIAENTRRDKLQLIETGFVIKPNITNNTHLQEVNEHVLYLRLRGLAEYLELKTLNSYKKIQYSGMIWLGKLLLDRYGKLDREEYTIISEQFKVNILTVEKIVNIEVINKIYGEQKYEGDFDLERIETFRLNSDQSILSKIASINDSTNNIQIKAEEEIDIFNVVLPYSKELDIDINDLLNYDTFEDLEPRIDKITINRLARDSRIARVLKKMYSNVCQMCNQPVKGSNGENIAEVHHIRPYNQIHNGQDKISNMIVLCPNHHSQFDQFYYAIHPENWIVYCLDESDRYHNKPLQRIKNHDFDRESLEYVWGIFMKKKQLYSS